VVRYRYPAAGTYPILLTATDARCHTPQLSDPVTVTVSPCGDRFCDDAEMGRCTLDCGTCERVGPCTPDACPPLTCTPLDDYAVVHAGLPTLLRCGGFAFARVTLKNLGSTDWTRQQGYALVSTTDDAVTHAMRVDVPADVTVHPQDTYMFEFPLLTPSSGSGVAHTTWRMTNGYTPFGPAMAQDIAYSQDNCGPGGLPPGGGVTSSSVIPVILDDGSGVYVYDITSPEKPVHGRVADLVVRADRSTKTDCTQKPAKGLIRGTSLGLNTSSPGDIVVVSDNYVAWFDTTKNDGGPQPGGRLAQDTWRGGQLAGFWTLSGADFKNKKPVPNCEGWAHNELIPGSASRNGETYFWDKFGPGIEQCLNVGCDTPTCHGTFFCFRYAQKGGTWRILTAPTSEDGGIRFKFGGRMANDEGSSVVAADGTFVDSAVEYLCRPDGIVMSWKFAASSTITTSNLFVYAWTGYGQDMDDTCCDEDPATNTYPDSVPGMDTFYTSSRDHSVGELVLDTKCNGQSKPAFACTSADEQQRVNKDSIPLQSPQIGEWLQSGESRQLPASGQTWTLQNKSQPGTGDGNQGNPERVAWDRFFSWNENAHDGTLGFGAARGPQKNTTLLKDRWYGTDLLLSTNGPNSVAVTSSGACAGSDCTVSFTATPRRPDVRTMTWSGCTVASGTAVSCVRATPGDVTARVDMTDGDGIAASATGTRTAYASGFSVGTWGPCAGTTTCTAAGPGGCQTTGTQTRTVSSSGLTLDPAAAATPPAASQACTAPGPGYVASYNSTYDANWTCTAAGANGCSKNRLSYTVSSFGPNAPDAPLPPSVLYAMGYAATYTATYEASWTCTGSGPTGCRKNRLSYAATSFSPTGPDAPVPAPAIYATGYVASYTATYEASWTCTASGASGCRKNRLSYSGATFTPTGPDAPPPAAAIYTTGYVASYTSTYDTNWTCTATGATGCRKNRLSYSPSSYNATGPDAPVPAAIIYTTGYVASWYVGPWSGCSASCGGGWQTRQVYANAWKAASPDAARPADTQGCNSNPCRLSCYDYGLYPTWGECYADGWAYCDTRYHDDGIGGLLTCRHGYN